MYKFISLHVWKILQFFFHAAAADMFRTPSAINFHVRAQIEMILDLEGSFPLLLEKNCKEIYTRADNLIFWAEHEQARARAKKRFNCILFN